MVGFGQALLARLGADLPPGSVTILEDPDLIAKRAVAAAAATLPCVGSVVAAPYHQSDAFLDALEGQDGFDAVIPALEYAVPAAAAAAERLGRPGAGTKAAAALSDKIVLREVTEAAGIATPRWREVGAAADVAAFAAGGAGGREIVLKPANRHASLGVRILAPGEDTTGAWADTVAARDDILLPDRPLRWRYLVEERVLGDEVSVEAIVARGEPRFLNITAKRVLPGPYPIETGHLLPAPLPPGPAAALAAAMGELIGAIGFGHGILHAEWMLPAGAPGVPVLIECAGRIPGDSIVELIDLAYGTNLARELLRTLGGEEPDLPAQATAGAAIRFLTAAPGRVAAVRGDAAARAVPGVRRVAVAVAPGGHVVPVRSSWDRVGEVLATGPDAGAAWAAANAAAGQVIVTVTDR